MDKPFKHHLDGDMVTGLRYIAFDLDVMEDSIVGEEFTKVRVPLDYFRCVKSGNTVVSSEIRRPRPVGNLSFMRPHGVRSYHP